MADSQQNKVVDADQIDLSGDGGVLKKILKAATTDEQPSAGCKVSLHYTGTLLDGTKFDSSVERNEPFEFELGKGVVVKAFDLGVASMKRGEKSVLTCAPEYAYGAAGSPPNIPPNSTLLFEIELLDWKLEDLSPKTNGGILRHVLSRTGTKKTPTEGASVKVHIVGKFEDRVFDDRELSLILGEIPDDEVISGVHTSLYHFSKGEVSKLTIKPEFAFGKDGHKEFNIPANATVEYTVTLIDFEKEPESWKLNPEESLAQAALVKEKATNFLKKGNYQLAIKIYEKSNLYLSNCNDDESQKVKAAVFLNIALCQLKLNNALEVKKACDIVLAIEPNNIKALFRRGQSHFYAGEPQLALTDFQKVHDLEPENKAAINQITICKQSIKQFNDKQKKLYSNMFTKFSNKEKSEEKEAIPETPIPCGEWNMEEEARKEADRVFEEVNQNVVML